MGRSVGRHAVTLLRIGHLARAGSLVVLALFARVVEVAGAGRLVDSVHTSVITLDVVTGSAIGDVAVCATGDATAAARWTGAVLTVLATCVLSAQTLVHERAHPQPARD
ncbi:hypothetical protein ACIA8R_45370 [Nonomuraea sp. NPDC051191]|uniref:hypothetical protein n=1 Tax=Nonomuraea sp. NPDC051191 TaxID=3364372 RepID=UPI0037ACA102